MARVMRCSICKTGNLMWDKNKNGKFKLHTRAGNLHICKDGSGQPSMGSEKPKVTDRKVLTLKQESNRQKLLGVLLSSYNLERGLLEELGVK